MLAAQSQRESDEFDRAFHVDTAGFILLEGTEVVGDHRDHGHTYLGIRPRDFRELLGAIPVEHEHYTFIDYGSGKGRALLLAAEWPFKTIIGVEFARELHRIAEDNIRTYQNPGRRCHAIRTLCMDAVEFEIPREPAILYFFNPFSETVLSAVLEKVRKSLEESPRRPLGGLPQSLGASPPRPGFLPRAVRFDAGLPHLQVPILLMPFGYRRSLVRGTRFAAWCARTRLRPVGTDETIPGAYPA